MADPATPAFTPMSPPAPMAMHSPTARPGLVTAAGVIEIVYGCVIALVGIIAIFFGSAIAALFKQTAGADVASLGGGIITAVGVVVAIVGVLYALLGLQVLKGKNWARITSIVFAGLGVLTGLGSIGRGGGLFGLAVNVFVIVALVVPASANWFKAMSGRPAA
jgi:hypothetical protein